MMDRKAKARAYKRLDEKADVPMAILSLAIIPLFVIPFAFNIPNGLERTFDIAAWAIWGVFVVELIVMTYLADKPLNHLGNRWYEIPAVVAPLLIVVADLSLGLLGFFVRPLRLLRTTRLARSSRLLRWGRSSRLISSLGRVTSSTRELLRRHGLQYALAVGAILYFLSAGLMVLFERNDGNITNYGDALWWGMTAMTPLPNNEFYPVTAEGRFVAVFVALLGLTLTGIVTANIAAYLMQEDQLSSQEFTQRINELEQTLSELRQSGESHQTPDKDSHRLL